MDRHTYNGIAKSAGKSKFNAGENITELVRSGAQMPGVRQVNGRIARTFDAGRDIDFDRSLGQQTNIMTVITEADGTLVTAFPGRP